MSAATSPGTGRLAASGYGVLSYNRHSLSAIIDEADLRLIKILILLLVLGITTVILSGFFAVEQTAAVTQAQPFDVDSALKVRALAKRWHKALLATNETVIISASESDLENILAFAVRAVPECWSRIEVRDKKLRAAVSLGLPANPLGNYVNIRMDLSESATGLSIDRLTLGRIKIPGSLALSVLRVTLYMLLGRTEGVEIMQSLHSVAFRQNGISVQLKAAAESKERFRKLAKGLRKLRDELAPLGDATVVRKYYETLIELAESNEIYAPVSLSSFMGPIFRLTQQRSTRFDPVAENRSAILALAMYFGSLHFELFIGPVRSGELLLHRPRFRKVRLAGRNDLALHFITSAGLKIIADSGISFAIGELKELLDSGGGSGFSFADLAANRAGIRFAEVATDSGRARKLQSLLQSLPGEALFFPTIEDLPEGLSQVEFDRIYGNVESSLYKAMMNEIERRISKLPAYRHD